MISSITSVSEAIFSELKNVVVWWSCPLLMHLKRYLINRDWLHHSTLICALNLRSNFLWHYKLVVHKRVTFHNKHIVLHLRYTIYPPLSMVIVETNFFGKYFKHLPATVCGDSCHRFPHSPWIMNVETSLCNLASKSLSRILAHNIINIIWM